MAFEKKHMKVINLTRYFYVFSLLRETLTDFTLFQVADITLQAVNSFSSDQAVTGSTGVIGHYTQVVWAETAEVGCGYMTSFVNDRFESVKIFLFLI